jgi:hypothetical protein
VTEVQNPATNCIQIPIVLGGPLDILSTASGDFTIDGWVYIPAPGTNGVTVFDYGDQPGTNAQLSLTLNPVGGSLQVLAVNIASWNGGTSSGLGTMTGAWHYFAMIRNGLGNPNGAIFWDNTRVNTFDWHTTYVQAAGSVLTIGNLNTSSGGGAVAPVFLEEFRVTNGTSLYPNCARSKRRAVRGYELSDESARRSDSGALRERSQRRRGAARLEARAGRVRDRGRARCHGNTDG